MSTSVAPADRIGPPALDFRYVQKALLRFYTNHSDETAKNLKVVKRKSAAARDTKHAVEILRAVEVGEEVSKNLIKRDRVRPGHIDTGEPIINGEVGVVLEDLAEKLIALGYQIIDFHVAEESRPAKKKGGEPRMRYISTFTLNYGAEPAENAEELLALLGKFVGQPCTLYVYDNVNNTATFNCTNLGQGKVRSVTTVDENEILVLDEIGSTEDLDVLETADGGLVGGDEVPNLLNMSEEEVASLDPDTLGRAIDHGLGLSK